MLEKMKKWLGEFSPNCRQAVRLQSQLLDGRLSWRQALGLRIHLALCEWCRRYTSQIQFLRGAAHDLAEKAPVLPSACLSAEARERLKHSLKDAA